MRWQKWCQMSTNANGPHAWTAATVRDAEGLVQVEVRDIGPEFARSSNTHKGIEVGAVHVNLPAVLVN